MTVVAKSVGVGPPGRPLRVAQVIGQLLVGGAERHVVNLLNAMPTVERSLIIVGGRDRPGVSLRASLDPAIPVERLPIRRSKLPGGIRRLVQLFREQRFDVVQSHMLWSNFCAAVAARLAGVPVIITTEHGEDRWKTTHHRWVERAVISRLADRRFCVSEAILRRRHESDGVPAERLLLVPNGTGVPAEPVTAVERATLTIGTVGRAVPEKDHGNLVAAVRQLADRGCSLRVVVVGDGPELDAVKTRVDHTGLTDLFEFPGMVEDVERWYREFDVFVLSSRQEGQPVALLEAMAIGLPCVATDVGAIATTLESGREGTVVEPGSPTALAKGLLRYLESLPLRAEHGRAARERVRREFSIEAVAARHLAEYRRILASKRPSMEVAGS